MVRSLSRWLMIDINDFFKGVSHPRSSNYCVCDGGCTHTCCRTHIFLHYNVHTPHFTCVWTRVSQKKVCSLSPSRPLHLHVSPVLAVSVWRALLVHCCCLLEFCLLQKRWACALPHERRGVWLPGQVRATRRMKPRSRRLRKTKSQIKHTGIRHGSHIPIDNEVFYIDPLNKDIHGDGNNVCLSRTNTFRHYCHLPFWCDMWDCFPLSTFLSCPCVKVLI